MGRVKKGRRRPGVSAPPKLSVDQLLDMAQLHLEQFELEQARQLLNQALEMDEVNIRALEMSASLLLDIGEMDAAKVCLQKAISAQPARGHSKYLSLAQLLSGREAAECYQRGIQLLQGPDAGATADAAQTARHLSSALCALADLYTTDLCDEPDAQQLCSQYIQQAIDADPSNPEAHHTQASYLLITGDTEAARAALRRSADLWLPAYQAAREGAAPAADPLEVCPLSYDQRLATVRSLIECEEWDLATQILDGLCEEDDECVDTWYLLGLINHERGSEYHNTARFYLRRARQVGEGRPEDDREVLEHVTQLLDQLGPGTDSDQEEQEEQGGEDEWTDEEDGQQMDTTDGHG